MSTTTDDASGSSELPLMAERLCVVCYEKSDGAHFGTDTCRACAAFFRRAVVSGRKYYCNQGDGKCEVSKAARCMCRKCRLEKCFTVGMRKEMVQGRRDPINPKNIQPAKGPQLQLNGSLLPLPLIWLSMETEPSLLKRVIANYRELRLKRRAIELALYPELVPKLQTSGPLTGFTQGTSDKLHNITKACGQAWMDFALGSFDHFAALDKEKQAKLFTSFSTLVWPMDKVYVTFRSIPKDLYLTISIVSETMYFDRNNCEYWITDCPQNAGPMRQELIKVMKNAMSRPRQKQIMLMNDMQIEEEEYAALLGLMLWNQNFEEGTEGLDLLVKSMREVIFRELEIYYKSRGINSYAERLGALMGVHGTVLVDVFRMKEDMELYNLMNAVRRDSVLLESLRNLGRF